MEIFREKSYVHFTLVDRKSKDVIKAEMESGQFIQFLCKLQKLYMTSIFINRKTEDFEIILLTK